MHKFSGVHKEYGISSPKSAKIRNKNESELLSDSSGDEVKALNNLPIPQNICNIKRNIHKEYNQQSAL